MYYVGVNCVCDDVGVGSVKKNGLGMGVVVGIVVGVVVVVLVLVVFLIFLLFCRCLKYFNRNNSKLYGEECFYICVFIYI